MVSLLFVRTIWRIRKHPSTLIPRTRFFGGNADNAKPLRILFCGSDEFSVASLRALQAESLQSPEFIKSIDVLCRPAKPTGRGLKNKQHVPLYHVAKELNLKIHQRDTFTDWNLPEPDGEAINLIVAVSFGLFIPPRLITYAEYGGLNVHPSILPNFRGPAPLQRQIMYGAQRTGVTLQTLDTKKFDHGVILAQERFRIPNPSTITYQKLLEWVTPPAAELLVQGLRNRLYLPPLIDVAKSSYESNLLPGRLSRAPKISKDDRNINWHRTDAAMRIDRRHRALGPMWSMLFVNKETQKRFVFHDFEIVQRPLAVQDMVWKWSTGAWFMNRVDESNFKPGDNMKTSSIASQKAQASKDRGNSTVSSMAPQKAQALINPKSDEAPLVSWQASTTDEPSQTEIAAFNSWQTLRNHQLAQENREAPKQNVYYMINEASSGERVPVFYIEDQSAIIVAVQGAGLRIREITVEGEKRKPAAEAMKMFHKKGMWNLQLQKVEGSPRWFAEFNENFQDTFDREKWKETLSPEEMEERDDEDLWFQIREEKRRELALYWPIELLKENAAKEEKDRAASKQTSKTRMRRVLQEVKEQKRAKRIEAENRAMEKEMIAETLKKNEEDAKRNDWSHLLLERQQAFFPEAYAEVRQKMRESVEEQRRPSQEAKNTEEKSPSKVKDPEETTKQEER